VGNLKRKEKQRKIFSMTTSTGVNGKEEAKEEVPGIYLDLQ
jgi:hypothetical protein